MARFIDESKFVAETVKNIDNKLNTKYTRFITDKPATYVTMYNINNAASTVDSGFLNAEKIIGDDSPIRFDEIKHYPLQEFGKIDIQLEEKEYGITNTYEGQATILPNMPLPVPNSVFLLESPESIFGSNGMAHDTMLFMITGFEQDTIRSHGFYRISFKLKYLGEHYMEDLSRQTVNKFTAKMTNPDNFMEGVTIIEDDVIDKQKSLRSLYEKLKKIYFKSYYNEGLNVFDCNEVVIPRNSQVPVEIVLPTLIYDRLLNNFICRNNIFSDKSEYKSIYLTNEDDCPHFEMEYEDSIFTALEERSVENLQPNYYAQLIPYTDMSESVFNFYSLDKLGFVRTIDESDMDRTYFSYLYLPPQLTESLATGPKVYKDVRYQIISDYFWGKLEDKKNIPYPLYNKIRFKTYNKENSIVDYIVLFIMNKILTKL